MLIEQPVLLALALLAFAVALVPALVFVHDAYRAARWDAGHRVR
jgi:hypothetical protein